MQIAFSQDELRPLVTAIVAEVLAQEESVKAKLGERLAYPEAEAAQLLGIRPHVLRDARLRGEIHAKLCGKRYLYSREVLVKFLSK